MPSIFYYLIAFLVLGLFIAVMLFSSTNKNKLYIKYLIFFYPFIALDYFPSTISPNLFDYITIIYLVLFYNYNKVEVKNGIIYFRLFILLTIIAILGIVFADSLSYLTSTALLQYFTVFCFAKILIDECISDRAFLFVVIDYLKIPLIISFVFLLIQLIVGPEFSFERSMNHNVIGGLSIRYPSFFQDPQKYAQFLSVSSFLVLIKNNDQKNIRLFNVILFIISIVAMMFTGGRAGLGGWLIGIVFLTLFGSIQYKTTIVLLGSILVAIFYNTSDVFPMFNRVVSLSEDYDFRYSIWQDAFKIYLDHPVLGIGIGNYSNYVSLHNPDQFWWADNAYAYFDHPESGYLKFLTEFGSIGFVSVFLLILTPIAFALQVFNRTKNYIIILLIAALISWLISFYTLYSFDDNRIKILIITIICFLITSYKWAILDDKK